MAEKFELNLKTDSQVALDLFYRYVYNLSDNDTKELYKDQDKLLKTFANFLYTVNHSEMLADIKK